MRTEEEMFDLILGIAERDERIRAVYMNGSRANPQAPKDIFQDYDIVYVVEETASFLGDEKWINVFGRALMIQEPDKLDQICGIEMDFTRSYAYLMLFADGNRIDLHIQTVETMLDEYTRDKVTIPLLDKDNWLPQMSAPTDVDYWIREPSEALYLRCCNNFWWCLQNVAKGIWRDEMPYAQQMYHYVISNLLNEMVSWWIGKEHSFNVSTGKMGKYFKKYLPTTYWNMYERTYCDGNSENMWTSLFTSCELFRVLAQDIAKHLNYTYPLADDTNMTDYLKHVRGLPADAKAIF